MYYIVGSNKSFEQGAADLEAAVKRNEYGVLHIHDLGATLRSNGIAFVEQCKVFEVGNPGQIGKVLATDMRLNMALPCRISVYTEQGQTKIGMIRAVPMLVELTQDASLVKVAQEVEAKVKKIIDESR